MRWIDDFSCCFYDIGGFDKLLYFWKRLLYATFSLIEAINKFFL